ncbi:hypothetical protein DL93DRAFT_2099379 [Clavulina sp. PMI_390]|nr:hypothetical protein DL93DRAFT_2099379 [Clavulina sp. PMI_390]
MPGQASIVPFPSLSHSLSSLQYATNIQNVPIYHQGSSGRSAESEEKLRRAIQLSQQQGASGMQSYPNTPGSSVGGSAPTSKDYLMMRRPIVFAPLHWPALLARSLLFRGIPQEGHTHPTNQQQPTPYASLSQPSLSPTTACIAGSGPGEAFAPPSHAPPSIAYLSGPSVHPIITPFLHRLLGQWRKSAESAGQAWRARVRYKWGMCAPSVWQSHRPPPSSSSLPYDCSRFSIEILHRAR